MSEVSVMLLEEKKSNLVKINKFNVGLVVRTLHGILYNATPNLWSLT